jgi:16S rRNA (cytosine1402-N4)-methyltransferase
MDFNHISVLLSESIEGLNINPNGIYVDGTVGGAGHSIEIAKKLSSSGKLIAFDRDPDAIKIAQSRLNEYKNVQILKSNYSEMKFELNKLGINKIDGILLDLGVSSHQLDTVDRGFSYSQDTDLDMRMSQEGITAKDVVNNYRLEELSRILFEYGEEKFARKIAYNIIKYREEKNIEKTSELVEIIKNSVPYKVKREKNPCKKTFQAIRIEVNKELEHLSLFLEDAFNLLNTNGRLAIITFHSLEDRLVKQRFNKLTKGCECPPEFPICICGKKPLGKLINKKPIEANQEELEVNNRSRSAKLRVIERI